MTTASVTATGAVATNAATPAGGTIAAELQEQFMTILLTQLRYQDPMAPMQEKDFFAQMAQFTTATEVSALNEKLDSLIAAVAQNRGRSDLLAAAGLIGSSFVAAVGDEVFAGIVEAVGLVDGKVFVRYGDLIVPLEDLVAVGGIEDEGQGE